MVEGFRTTSMGNRVAVVTGGGGGIGAASAFELARQGAAVVVVDNGVGVEGEPLGELTAAETAARITEAGGTARAATTSVTDGDAIAGLFGDIVEEFGSLDVVVNAAGIIRSPRLVDADDADWRAVLDVHVNGYLNVLAAALPIMGAAGYGRVVGFTSGVGLARTSGETLAYGCAKRTIASLTWQLGPCAPAGVAINVLSPIAATRMVRGAILASGAGPRGLDLSAMPQAAAMAPAAAYLSSERFGWCRGQVVFSAGSELSVISGPRLLECVRTDGVEDVASSLDTLFPVVFGPAEARQRTTGGSNPRFGAVFDAAAPGAGEHRGPGGADAPTCLLVGDDDAVTGEIGAALGRWGWGSIRMSGRGGGVATGGPGPADFDAASDAVADAVAHPGDAGPIGAVVVVGDAGGGGGTVEESPAGWRQVVHDHRQNVGRLLFHAAWTRAVARLSAATGRPVRLVHVVPAGGPAGRSAAQAVAQMARSANESPGVVSTSVSVESEAGVDRGPLAHLVARLVCADDAAALAGAELVVARGWLGIRSHPEPAATVSFGGPEIPGWVDRCLREAVGAPAAG
jgi:NAD(P)-dependent dehydrogenase (short-subunit alcohol dehydrogenase family)